MSVAVMPVQWAEFNDIDDVEPLNEEDADCLKEIRDVLKKHGMDQRFGVALLHKHFDLEDDEIMLETSDHDARKLVLEPTKVSDAGNNNVGTIFALRDGEFEVMSHCHQYCKRGIMGNHFGAHRKIK